MKQIAARFDSEYALPETGTAAASQLAVSPPQPCLRSSLRPAPLEAPVERAFDHERLDVYGVAAEFVVLADAVVADLPRGRAYLADQLQRAATSIVLNIAEGAGEKSPPDKARFYRFACRSATECAAILDLCQRLGLSDSARVAEGRSLLVRSVQMLVRLSQSLE